jgi:hypothetical protein
MTPSSRLAFARALSHLDTYYLAWPRAFSCTLEGAAAKRMAA